MLLREALPLGNTYIQYRSCNKRGDDDNDTDWIAITNGHHFVMPYCGKILLGTDTLKLAAGVYGIKPRLALAYMNEMTWQMLQDRRVCSVLLHNSSCQGLPL